MLFNGILCAGVGWILLFFMAKPAGLVGAIIFWVAATVLWEGKRYVDRLLPLEGNRGSRGSRGRRAQIRDELSRLKQRVFGAAPENLAPNVVAIKAA